MFELLGYLISLILLAIVVTLLTEYTKKLGFITKLSEWFAGKIKFISWYQFEAILIALILLNVLGLLNAITLGTFALILNAIVIGLISNGIFTYQFIKGLMLKLKITAKIIEIIEPVKAMTKKSTKKSTKK